MKELITYGSKSGASKRYADWLADSRKMQALSFRDISPKDYPDLERMIHFGGLYAGAPLGLKELEKYFPKVPIILICVGLLQRKRWIRIF